MKHKDVEWIVNDIAELGVKIGDSFHFLYKGDSYLGGQKWRPVGKREFGECCHPWQSIEKKSGKAELPETYIGFHGEEFLVWRDLPQSEEMSGENPGSEPPKPGPSPEDQAKLRERFAVIWHFDYAHLKPESQAVSREFHELAYRMAARGDNDPQETAAGLRKLLEAKDCAVRAARPRPKEELKWGLKK